MHKIVKKNAKQKLLSRQESHAVKNVGRADKNVGCGKSKDASKPVLTDLTVAIAGLADNNGYNFNFT